MAMSILGTTISQLFSITHHDSGFGYTAVGKPLATVCFISSIGTLLLGATRCWRHQRSMINGKALVSGFEVNAIGAGVALVSSMALSSS